MNQIDSALQHEPSLLDVEASKEEYKMKIRRFLYDVLEMNRGEFEESWNKLLNYVDIALVIPQGVEAESVIQEIEEAQLMPQLIEVFESEFAVMGMNRIDEEPSIEDNCIVFSFKA